MTAQMDNLLRRYGVRTETQLLDAIRREWTEETGVSTTRRVAAVYLDQMLEAEFQRIESAAQAAEETKP